MTHLPYGTAGHQPAYLPNVAVGTILVWSTPCLVQREDRGASANKQDGARLDVSANGVWGGRHQKTYFDVRALAPWN